MDIHQFLNLIGKKKQTIASLLLVFLASAIIFSAIVPFKYNSSLNLLAIINFKESVDPYTASRSNEYVSSLLSRIVSSGTFFEQIKSSGFNIDKDYFSGNEKKQMKKWAQTAKAKSVADTGMISLNIYHSDRAQAEEIARAVAYTLQTTNSQYHGFGNGVEIKIIDQPITSNYPVLPNIPLNLGLAAAFAVIFFLCYIYLFPERRYDIRLWPKKNIGRRVAAEELKEDEFIEPVFSPEQVSIYAEAESEAADLEREILKYREKKEEALDEDVPYNPENYQNKGSMENILRR
jgi:capsular polysaccharide biosynthesis protein